MKEKTYKRFARTGFIILSFYLIFGLYGGGESSTDNLFSIIALILITLIFLATTILFMLVPLAHFGWKKEDIKPLVEKK